MYYPGVGTSLFLAALAVSPVWVLACCWATYKVQFRLKGDSSYTLDMFWGFERRIDPSNAVPYTIIVAIGVWILVLSKIFIVVFI